MGDKRIIIPKNQGEILCAADSLDHLVYMPSCCAAFFSHIFFIPRCVVSWFYFLLALYLLLFLFFIFFLHGSKQTLETKYTQKGPLDVNDPPNASVGKCTSAEPIHMTGIFMKTGRKGKYDLKGWEMTDAIFTYGRFHAKQRTGNLGDQHHGL